MASAADSSESNVGVIAMRLCNYHSHLPDAQAFALSYCRNMVRCVGLEQNVLL